jgi:hypothetical protein
LTSHSPIISELTRVLAATAVDIVVNSASGDESLSSDGEPWFTFHIRSAIPDIVGAHFGFTSSFPPLPKTGP